MASPESIQWLREFYGEQKGEQEYHFTSKNMPISASRITFYFFKLFQDASNLFNFNIFD
jgi:hypothetical protein